MKMKTTLCAAALLALASPAFAALTYSYSIAPGFSGGTYYLDDIAGTALGQPNTPFASGDLTDGVLAPNSPPTQNTGIVAWDPTPLAATITIDLGILTDVSAIDITTFAWSPYALGAPIGVTIDYSATTTFEGPGTYHAFTDGGDGSVSHAGEVTTSASGVRFIQLAFDGTTTTGGKWGLTEIGVSLGTDPKLIAGTGLDFGRLPANSDPVDASLALQNDGAANSLDISGVTVTGANAANFSITAHPATLAPGGGTGNIDVSFNPNGSNGNFTAQLEINSNDPLNPTLTVPLLAYVDFSGPLVAWWPLDNDSTDASGHGFDGLDQGVITYSQPGATAASATAALFAGGGHIDIPWDMALNTRDFSVTLWANADAAGGGHRSPVTNRDDVAPGGTYRHGWIIYKNPGGLWQFWNGGGRMADGAWNAASAGSVDFGNWHHIAITYDSFTNTKTFYVDGSLMSTSNPAAFSPNNSNIADGFTHEDEDLHIGGGGDAGTQYRWMGLIDDVGLFRTALSGEQIASIMANGVGSLISSTRFEIISVVRNSDTEVEITWNSKPGITYAIDRSLGRGTFNWGEVDDGTIGAGETATYTDSSIPAGSKDVFYRVRVVE